MKDRQVSRKAGDDWATPKNLYEKLNNEFGNMFDNPEMNKKEEKNEPNGR